MQNQVPLLSEFDKSKNKKLQRLNLQCVNVDSEKLQILLTISKFDGIGAKALGEKVHLSRYAALAHAKQLVELGLVICEKIPSPKTGIKPAYSFHLAPDLTKEAIESAIQQKESKSTVLLNSEGFMHNNVSERTDKELQQYSVIDMTSNNNNGMTEFGSLKLRILQLPSGARSILRLFLSKSYGMTANEISEKINRKQPTFHKYLKELLELGLITREKSSTNGKKQYAYSFPPGLIAEQINVILSSLEPEMSGQQVVDVSSSTTNSTPSSEETQNQDNSINFMQPESSQEQNESTQPTEDTQATPELMEVVQELIVLYRKVSALEKNLLKVGGKKAEKLIKTLRTKKV